MTNVDLAAAYLSKARSRLDVLDLLIGKGAYSDVVREAQEIVELATKGMLRRVGVDPPKIHDVSGVILENRVRFPGVSDVELDRLVAESKALRRDRELSFYGDVDFIPTEEYSLIDAEKARAAANFVVAIAGRIIAKG